MLLRSRDVKVRLTSSNGINGRVFLLLLEVDIAIGLEALLVEVKVVFFRWIAIIFLGMGSHGGRIWSGGWREPRRKAGVWGGLRV